MTEVASLMPTDHRLTSVRHYEAGPPAGLELVEPGETFATTKEEEWVSKKKTEVLNTKQIETRVKRQVVLEDGKVVEDTGPMVTTNTTEDTETQEHHQTELRKLGDDDGTKAIAGNDTDQVDKSNWIAVPNPDGIVREVKERRVVSREETEEIKETEDVHHLGDITDEEFLAAVHSGRHDLRQVLRNKHGNRTVLSTGPRLVRDTSKTNKVTDTEETRELSSVQADGKIVTETQRTTEHEEVNDDELPTGAPIPDDYEKETSQRYLKTRDQEDVDYIANGVNVGHKMRFKTETMEVERRGDGGADETDCFDSLSARIRRNRTTGGNMPQQRQQPHRYRGLENGESPLDRKDALTRRPLDFDQEEETRKVETSKWLEHHFGSESRSSSNSVVDDEEQPPKTSFFNVTIKSQPTTIRTTNEQTYSQKTYISTAMNNGQRVYSPVEAERDRNPSGFYKGISDWSERRQQQTTSVRQSPVQFRAQSPPPVMVRNSPSPDYRPHRSPIPDYRSNYSPTPDYNRNHVVVVSATTPTPPQRKRSERRRMEERGGRYESSGARYSRTSRTDEEEMRRMEPPPDYSPPNNVPPMQNEKKMMQKTRFAVDAPKVKSGNIIGQSIRKLVGKIRSASAERKARQRAKRSPSPSYQQGHIIDGNISGQQQQHHHHTMERPVQRYYLGEDPFAGSIYGRENKYDGVRPARNSRRSNHQNRDDEQQRSQSTLGRFSKSTGRLVSEEQRNSQTLPRHHYRNEPPTRLENQNRSNSTINVSIINTVSPQQHQRHQQQQHIVNDGPTKPARTYRSNLSRSKSLNVHMNNDTSNMYTSNSHLNRLNASPIGLKSPGLISSLDRSQKEVNVGSTTAAVTTGRFAMRNGSSESTNVVENKRIFLSNLKERAPELFKTLHETENDEENWKVTSFKQRSSGYNGDIYEPPTRLRPTENQLLLRRGSNSSTDYSETYHTTTRNDDPVRPSVTNTVKSFTKRTVPSKDGRAMETIESSETKSVTKSHYRGGNGEQMKYYDDKIYSSGNKPVVIEVRNYRK